MAIRIVKLDETQYWHEDIVKRAGKIFGAYLYDDQTRTFCCELTPSYEFNFAGYIPEDGPKLSDEDMEKLEEEIRVAQYDSESVRYYHCYSIDAKPEGIYGKGEVLKKSCEDIEEAMEYILGNGYVV